MSKKYFWTFLSLYLGFYAFTGCNPEDFKSVDCADCSPQKPDTATLTIHLTLNQENPEVLLKVYEYSIDENTIIYEDSVSASTFYLNYCPLGRRYLAEAKYQKGDHTIIAFDAQDLKSRKVTAECSNECYILQGDELDLRLKEK